MRLNFASRRKLSKQIYGALEDGDPHVSITFHRQRQPYTFIEVMFDDIDNENMGDAGGTVGLGFSKCRWPDTFLPHVGRTYALRSALDDLVIALWETDEIPF